MDKELGKKLNFISYVYKELENILLESEAKTGIKIKDKEWHRFSFDFTKNSETGSFVVKNIDLD